MRIASVLVCFSCFIGACASASPPAATAAGQASPSGSATSAPEASSQNDAPRPDIESQRESFIHACMEKAHLADYCSCGFDQFREVFKDADLTKAIEPGDARVKALQERTVAQCASKLTDEQVKANFIEGCEGGDSRKAKYCACAWPALRKQLSLVDFIGDADSPRFTQAKQALLVSCKGKFPAEVAKSDFMSGCTKDHPEREIVCKCFWKKVTAKFSVDEIAHVAIDIKSTPGLSECQK